jgi:hypothetical protein
MAKSEAAPEQHTTRRPVVVVLVGSVDRRILPALRFVSGLPRTDIRALHVSVDPERTRQLASDWMELGLSWLPLDIHEPTADSLPVAVRQLVEGHASGTRELLVVLPEFDSSRWWHPLLHRRSARRIATQLHGLPNVTAVIVPSPPSRPVTRGGL